MTWAAEDVTLGQASPPNLFIVGTASNVDSWSEEVFTIPSSLEQGINRRRLLYMVMRGISSPASSQIDNLRWNYTYTFVTRAGMIVSPHVITLIGMTALKSGGADAENLPICAWTNPFIFPLRGGDLLTTHVPGDSNATPTQDWNLEMLFGPELKR